MKTYIYKDLSPEAREALCVRNAVNDSSINVTVEDIIKKVRIEGDKALLDYATQFDKVMLKQLSVKQPQLEALAATVVEKQRLAIQTAYANIYKFHKAQLRTEEKIETIKGVMCWRENRAIERVGIYVPGGTAVLPSTFLMLAIPAKIAGCEKIVVCSPPQKNGSINGYIAYCALLLEIDTIYLTGGAQAIAAMAYGTESIPKVDKIFGPGNRYVTNAKSILQSMGQVAIDMPAGPSEVLVIADHTSKPAFVASDLLAQAEHGADSQVVLVATSMKVIEAVLSETRLQLKGLERAGIASKALENSYTMLVGSLEEAMVFSNLYAPEHLIIASEQYQGLISGIKNAGSVFLGNYTPEAAGDYASGTNHTLPTSGFAKAYSGVSVDSFIKKITFQYIDKEGIRNLGPFVETLADLEGLQGHKDAVSLRLKEISPLINK
jgi:histidinol dehydrogenase